MTEALFQTIIQGILIAMVGSLIPAAYRLIVGPRIADRMIAVDLITTILIGMMVLLALIEGQSLLVDVALALSALSFVGTLGIARFVGQGSVF